MLTLCPVALGAGVADTGVTPLLARGLATAGSAAGGDVDRPVVEVQAARRTNSPRVTG